MVIPEQIYTMNIIAIWEFINTLTFALLNWFIIVEPFQIAIKMISQSRTGKGLVISASYVVILLKSDDSHLFGNVTQYYMGFSLSSGWAAVNQILCDAQY